MNETKDYKVTFVEKRDTYPTNYGDMQSYALQLEGVDGYVQLGQKMTTPEPQVGQVLHGYTYVQESSKGSFLKFKKVSQNYAQPGSKPQEQLSTSGDTQYMITLLEALVQHAGIQGVLRPSSQKDVVLEDIDENDNIDLSEIPF